MHLKGLTKTLLVMKLTALILLIGCLQVTAKGFSQETITLSKKDATLKEVLLEISRQTGYNYFFVDQWEQQAKKVSIEVYKASLGEVLDLCFKDQPFTYAIVNRTIVIKERRVEENNFSLSIHISRITGKVQNEKGEPLVGASVYIKNSNRGTFTDEKGVFEFTNISSDVKIKISYSGYQTKEFQIHGEKSIILVLAISNSSLDQVQVIAYGTTTQRLSTGNVSTVKGEEIEKQPINNPLLALEGRVPGLYITQSTGLPGTGVTVRIQGQNSIGNGNDPLIVVDGVPYLSQNLGTFQGSSILGSSIGNQGAVGNPLSYINPADIESIDILKDADATAIYGSRAANGAILITTKKGKTGQTMVDINLQQGYGKVGHFIDLMNSQQYLEMRREAIANDSVTVQPSDYDLNGLWDTARYTNWQKTLIGGTAQYSQYSANVSGGTTNMQYLVGGTYHHETTVFPGSFADTKGSIHFNINSASVNQRFRLQFSGSYMVDNSNLPGTDLTNDIFLAPVAPPLYNNDGTLDWAPNVSGNSSWTNPLSLIYNPFSTKTSSLVSNALVSYRIMPGLELKSSFGYTTLVSNQFSTNLINSVAPENRPNYYRYAYFSFNTSNSFIVEPQLSYRKNLGIGKIDLLIGSSIQEQDNNGQEIIAAGQSDDQLLQDIAAATIIYPYNADISTYKYNAGFSRLNYNWQDKYIIDLTVRRDGSSRFGDQNKFHNFASIGGAWIFSQEDIVRKEVPFLSFGKFRTSYGTTGSDKIGNYQYLNLYSPYSTGTAYQNVPSLSPSGLSNPYLQWEETRKLEAGIDLGFIDNRILLNATYVRNRSSNQLLNYNLPIITGFTGITSNFPAVVQNTEGELMLSTENIRTKQFKWISSINLTIPNNKLIAFPGLATSSYNGQVAIGQPLEERGFFKTYRFYGVDPATGIYLVYGQNGKPTSSPNPATDLSVFISSKPKIYGGVQNSFEYGGFQMEFLLQFVIQKYFNFLGGATQTIPGNFNDGSGNQPVSELARWQKPGDITSIERFSSNYSLGSYVSGDQAIQNVSFLRLKTFSISYQLAQNFIKKAHLAGFRIFMNAQNVFTITPYKGLDPEYFSTTTLPPLRVITFGVHLGL